MNISLFIQGIILGFSIAAPVGPIGVLCIRRTLVNGRLHGLFSGLGAATADTFYGIVAGLGLTLVSSFLIDHQYIIGLVGGLFLLYLGFRTFITLPAEFAAPAKDSKGLLGSYLTTVILTMANPMTILSFTMVFAGLGIRQGQYDTTTAISLFLGVFIGSALWWLFLTTGVSVFRSRFTTTALRWVNRISGVILCVFGSIILIHLFLTL